MSSLRFAMLVGTLGLLAGCPQEPASKLCPGTGILCPEDMYCGAVQPVCLTTACGNGLVDPGEECDDGNVLGQDTCSPICRREACGNNVLDPGEVCDDGNGAAGDGCSPSCKSKEVCGNGIVDMGELCDDGNATNADGCSGTPVTVNNMMSPDACKSTEVCGNGIKDIQTGEVCDDGNTTSGDGCNSDCRSGEGCGNGIVDPGEQCDDGDNDDNDDCLNSCKTAKCGDGVVSSTGTRNESCDPSTTGSPIETATCNIDCTTRVCGDGKVNQTSGEQCDNGVGNNGDTRNCTAVCALNVCGDNKVDGQIPGVEQCDDGNQNNTDGCSNSCQLASCGNSTVDSGEMCDDGNMDQTDACVMCANAICGDGHIRAGVEACDDNNLMNGDGCSSTCRTEGCGNGTLDPGEECDDGNAVNTDSCVQGCRIAVCGDTYIRMTVEQCDDGNVLNGDGCSNLCRPEGCGNGQLDPGEACDDGNMASGDGCSATCTFESCGDGIVNAGEACDGNGAGQGGETATCNGDCTTRTCGDAKVNATAGEQCDSGTVGGVNQNANNRDCTAICKINICTDGNLNSIGPSRLEACDDGNMIATDGCNNNCQLASCGNGLLDPGEQCDDQNAVNTDSCLNNCMIASCGDMLTETGVEECDGAAVTLPGGPYTCSPTCFLQRCGNGIIDPTKGEECDNDVSAVGATPMSGDGCNAACKVEFCGDDVTNDRGHEECDDTLTGSSACDSNCTLPSCGDSTVNRFHVPTGGSVTEQCDPPAPGNGCSALCRFENCGNNITDPGEECDVGAATTSTCYGSSDLVRGCLKIECGNKRIDNGETCDVGMPVGGVTAGCSALCQIVPLCGDGVTNGSEACDPTAAGQSTATCDLDCTLRQCGDGFVGFGETCDPATGAGGNATTALASTRNCNVDCSVSLCGDMKINTNDNEQCDNGGSNGNTAACTATCQNARCGDGFNGPGELCDFGTGNNAGQIPAACPYNTSCQVCPSGCTLAATAGTGPNCGDGAIQMSNGEQCDTNNLASMTCSSFVNPALPGSMNYNAGTLTCLQCAFDKSDCSTCGDSVVQGQEVCDNGTNNGMDLCTSTGMAPVYNTPCNGCSSGCSTTVVIGTRCGDGTINGGEACDGTAFAPVGMPAMPPTCATQAPSTPFGSLRCTNTCTISTSACSVNPPTCTDNTINQMETDEDCGGPVGTNGCVRCATGKTCAVDSDCDSQLCDGGTNKCKAAPNKCNDGLLNQGETAIDCGGSGNGCQRCANSQACTAGTDCASGYCPTVPGQDVCEPACGDGTKNGTEVCDTNDFGGASCSTIVGPGSTGTLACDGACSMITTSSCSAAYSCGDGLVTTGEQCDDGVATMPGCHQTLCTVTTGYYCSGAPSVCTTVCGDGIKAGAETCDGGDLAGQTCVTQGFPGGGPLTCTPGCGSFDSSGCMP